MNSIAEPMIPSVCRSLESATICETCGFAAMPRKKCNQYHLIIPIGYPNPKRAAPITENLPPLAFISYCNDSARIEKNVAKIAPKPEGKDFLQTYPAVKITWLGVSKDSHRMGAGTDMLDITKLLFASEENRTGCRIITVDARGSEEAVALYTKAGFIFANDNYTPEKQPGKRLYPMVFNLLGPWEYDHSLLQPLHRH